MNKLSASLKDSAAQRARVPLQHCYRVGSRFKGCRKCGMTEMVETKRGEQEVWLDGFNVYRAYDPKWKGWTWWCYDCGAMDFVCWDETEYGRAELGLPPVQGTRDAKEVAKERRLGQGAKVDPAKQQEIAALELQLKHLELLKESR